MHLSGNLLNSFHNHGIGTKMIVMEMGTKNLEQHLDTILIETEADILHYARLITVPLQEFHQG